MEDVTRLNRCARCGADLPPGSAGELCPACLLARGDTPTLTADALTRADMSTSDVPTMATPTGASDSEHPTFLSNGSEPGAGRMRGPRPAPGQAFGPFRIERPLGSGGMGDVYEAEHVEHGRRVAVKVLGQRLLGEDDRERFLREGELAASITHANTVYIYGSEEIDGSPVIAMELLSGGTLKDLVEARGPLPPREAVDLILQVTAGLEAAQAAGILHRDIKPANCFIDRGGGVKVGDFGLSISTLAREGAATGTFQGTPQFAAPEQLRGEALDVRADIYAVGATLFYLLTGLPPFDDRDLTTLISRVQAEMPRVPRAMRGRIPDALAEVVTHCLAKNRDDRPASYAALADDLSPFSSSAPTPATLTRRFVAGIIDIVVLVIVLTPVTMVLAFQQGASSRWLLNIFHILVGLLYFGVFEGVWGAALGKLLCRIRVYGQDGRPPGFARAAARAAFISLPSFLGLIPMGIMGAERFAQFALLQPGSALLITGGFNSVLIALFVTARRHNGLAAVHDLVTGTRVVRYVTKTEREVFGVAPEAALREAPHLRRYGPFDVVAAMGVSGDGTLLRAVDPRLKRGAWIHVRPVDAAPVEPRVRDVSRPSRPRWLAGRRSAIEAWDAYEAFDGAPLLRIDAAQPWGIVKRWLLDLSREVEAGLADNSLPALAIARVWITRGGQAILLDFPAPEVPMDGSSEMPALASAQTWLSAVAERGLAGPRAMGPDGAPRVLPESAGAVLTRLAARGFSSASDMVDAFQDLVAHPDIVTRRTRGLMIALGGVTPMVLALLGVLAAASMQRVPPDSEAMARSLGRLSQLTDHPSPETAAERAALETYLAGRYAPTIRQELTWSLIVDGTRLARYRPLAVQAVANHPQVSPDELERAKITLGPFLQGEAKSVTDATRRAEIAMSVVPAFLFVAGFAITAGFGVLFALAFGSGLLLKGLGVAVINRHGARASRLRALLRAFVAWAPAAAFGAGLYTAHITFTNGSYHARYPVAVVISLASFLIFLGGAVFAALNPTRGLQDYVAGTWLVPR